MKLVYIICVAVLKSQPKPKQSARKSHSDLMSDATRRLMRGIKAHAKKTGQSVSREELRRQGFPESFISQFESA
jgi:hypothetical protein